MNKLLLLITTVFLFSCSNVEYKYIESSHLPDSLKYNLRQDFIQVVDVDTITLSGDPDYDDDIAEIYNRLRLTYIVDVGKLKIHDNNGVRYIYEHDLGDNLKPIYDSLKVEYYGHKR